MESIEDNFRFPGVHVCPTGLCLYGKDVLWLTKKLYFAYILSDFSLSGHLNWASRSETQLHGISSLDGHLFIHCRWLDNHAKEQLEANFLSVIKEVYTDWQEPDRVISYLDDFGASSRGKNATTNAPVVNRDLDFLFRLARSSKVLSNSSSAESHPFVEHFRRDLEAVSENNVYVMSGVKNGSIDSEM